MAGGVDPQDSIQAAGVLFVAGALPELAVGLAAWTLGALGRPPGHALSRPVVGLDQPFHPARDVDLWLAPGPPATSVLGLADADGRVTPAPRSAVFFGDLADAPARVLDGILDALPAGATVVVDALARETLAAVQRRAFRPVVFGMEGDPGSGPPPVWTGAPYRHQGGVQPLELFVGGTSCGRLFSPLPGATLSRLVVGTIAWLAEDQGLAAREAGSGLRSYRGVQDLLFPVGRAAGVEVVVHRTERAEARRVGVEATRARRPDARVLAVAGDDGAGLAFADEVLGGFSSPAAAAVDVLGHARSGDVVLVTNDAATEHADAILGALTGRALAGPV